MTKRRSADDFLIDIVLWGEKTASYVAGLTSEAFYESSLIQDAVARCIEVIGDAARRADKLDPSITKGHSDFDIDRAYGARNVIAHAYDQVDPLILWTTATESIPEFVVVARRIIAERKARQV